MFRGVGAVSSLGGCRSSCPCASDAAPAGGVRDRLLDETGLALGPVVLAYDPDYSRRWISTRVSLLLHSRLLENVQGSVYRISDLGRAYLVGDLDADELED